MVSANQTRIAAVLGGKHHLRVPLYQRRYAWKRDEWTALWDDVLHLALARKADSGERHFLGSVVLAPTPNGAADARLVIDGQQRLLTTSLLLSALRDGESRLPAPLRARVDRCLLVASGKGGPLKRLKLLPTQFDQNAFSRVVHRQELEPAHEATKAYLFFLKRLASMQQGDDENVEGMATAEVVRAVLDGLECVSVVADDSDNVHRIFESLNNRGQPLTQADLIRNYVFMRLSSNAEDFHEYTWKPLEERFSADELTQLFWLDLVRDRPTITQRQTYVEQQKKLHKKTTPTSLKKAIDEVVCAGASWDRILRPEHELSKVVRNRLERLKEWKTTTVWPVLMFLLEERERGASTSAQVARAMQHLESYFVRRVVIGRATDNMNRVLLAAPQSMRESDEPVDVALRRYLSGENKHWATDDELRREVGTKAFYNHGKAFQKTLILTWLELELAGGEYVLADDFTVEHVMPQTPTSAWRAEVKSGAAPGENVDLLYSGLVNTLGNLTLARSGRNSQMGNKSFADKKAILAKHGSGLQMTKEITKKHHWRPDDIRKRSAVMVERIIKTWPGPLEK